MSDDHESNALPAWMYGDPAEVYERKESATCKGCAHIGHALGRSYCEKNQKSRPAKCARYYKEEE